MNQSPDPIDDLVAECLRRIEDGREDAVAGVCAENPDRAKQIAARVESLTKYGMIGEQQPHARAGPYTLLRRIGAGGMGEVFLAQQAHPVLRLVALKLIKPGMDTEQVITRFEMERQALALLNHDGIAKVFDAGSTDDGRLYFAMELVEGEPITEWCARHRAPIERRLRLIIDVCRAVEHAHQAGIIHRDLKPSNILVSGEAHAPLAKVIDFGLAKVIHTARLDETFTEPGHVVGTLEYLSPEQTGLDARRVDTRSDVYALGVLLYLLVTGKHPLDIERIRNGTLSEAFRAIGHELPFRPSARAASDSGSSFPRECGLRSAADLARHLRGDLDWIIGRAIEKEPDRRYAGVADLAHDLERHLAHLPVLAGPPSTLYVVGRFIRRHRGAVTASATILLLVAAAFAVILSFWLENRRMAEKYRKSALENERSHTDFANLKQAQDLEEQLQKEQTEAWPATPEGIAPLERWITAVDLMKTRLPLFRETLGNLGHDNRAEVLRSQLTRTIEHLTAIGQDDAQYERCRRRLVWARELDGSTRSKYRLRWDEARHAIQAHPDYGGLDLPTQVGLVPLGPDPESTLWEFAYLLPGGVIPERPPGESILPRPDDCPILVLIPPTREPQWFGAQGDDPDGPNFDPAAEPQEGPPFSRDVKAYFIGKHELSHAHWRRMTRGEPGPFQYLDMVPASLISWINADYTLRAWGLRLPTEVEWERAARAGTTTPWFTGKTIESHKGYTNVGDESREKLRRRSEGRAPWNDRRAGYDHIDGISMARLADLPAILPNGYGLHHMTGNVAEHCVDPYDPRGASTPNSPCICMDERARRGGSYFSGVESARSAFRLRFNIEASNETTGVRVARSVHVQRKEP